MTNFTAVRPTFCAAVLALALPVIASTSANPTPSPSAYAGEQQRAIKSLSADDIQSLRAGKGMGLAKAAELNGYPGPMHVLQLAKQLQLSAEQLSQTQALFRAMQAKASALGAQLVEAERQLDELFAQRRATRASVTQHTAQIAGLQAQVRATHLDVHIEQAALLSPEQLAQYDMLRGYTGGHGNGSADTHHHQH
jgi:Spy/CpxP family protein refolding chaperone